MLVFASASPSAEAAPARPPVEKIQRAIDAAQRFLISRIDANGMSVGEADPNNSRYGGKTALLAGALLWARTDPANCKPLARSLAWLSEAKLTGTYAVALRACAMGMLDDANSLRVLAADAKWLVRAANNRGAYTYTSCDGKASKRWDNSNSQLALLGVSAALQRGVDIPAAYLRLVERHWLSTQQADGGWGYLTNPRTNTARSYGSMTAAGLASLYVCLDYLHGEQFIRCAGPGESAAAVKALDWLGENFDATANPRKGIEWYDYWLYCVARVGLASGHKYLGGHDWFAEAAAALLARQNYDGSFGYGDCVTETAFDLMFLVRGLNPVLVNKLQYPGRWDPRPRDAANLTRWMSRKFERHMNWQIVTLDSPVDQWHEAAVLYLSGAGPVDISAAGIAKLRLFVQQGGTIVSEAACNSGDFTIDMGKLYAKMFPNYPLIRLPASHKLYSAYFPLDKDAAPLFAVTNGVRLLAVHSPKELSLSLQMGPRDAQVPTYQLTANIWACATDRTMVRPRSRQPWPAEDKTPPRATIRVARLAHKANCDPEPLAWQRFARRVKQQFNVLLDISAPMAITDLDPNTWPVAHMTGTDLLQLTDKQKAALRKYLATGGTLVADAAGGSSLFTKSFTEQILPLANGDRTGRLAEENPISQAGPYKLDKIRYRSEYARSLGDSEKTHINLQAALKGDRPVILFSEPDITTGLLGIPVFGLKGYTPDSAERIMTNILFYIGGVRTAAHATEK